MKNHSLTLSNEQLIQRILSLETQLSEQKSVLDDNEKSLLKKDVQLNNKDAELTKKSDKIATLEEYIRYMTQ